MLLVGTENTFSETAQTKNFRLNSEEVWQNQLSVNKPIIMKYKTLSTDKSCGHVTCCLMLFLKSTTSCQIGCCRAIVAIYL